MVQASRFSNGGFVLHKVLLNGKRGHFSAWFTAHGDLIDAEQFTPKGIVRPVSPAAAHVRAELHRIGRMYLAQPA